MADEVRKLAEASNKAGGQITQLISEIQSETHVTVAHMEENLQAVNEQAGLIQHSGEALNRIVSNVEQTQSDAEKMSLVLNELNSNATEVLQAIEENFYHYRGSSSFCRGGSRGS